MSAASPIAAAPDDLVIDVPPSAEALKRGLIVAAIIAFITLVSSMMIFTMVRALLAGTGPWVIVIPLGLISLIFPVVLSTLINQGVFRPLMSGLRTVRFHLSAARLDVLY